MSLSNYEEDILLDYLLEASLYLALSTADPGGDGSTIAEPSGDGYARVAMTAASWAAASGGSKATSADLTFPAAEGNWGTITHFAIFDDSTGGNMLAYGALTASKAITTGQTLKFSAGNLTATGG